MEGAHITHPHWYHLGPNCHPTPNLVSSVELGQFHMHSSSPISESQKGCHFCAFFAVETCVIFASAIDMYHFAMTELCDHVREGRDVSFPGDVNEVHCVKFEQGVSTNSLTIDSVVSNWHIALSQVRQRLVPHALLEDHGDVPAGVECHCGRCRVFRARGSTSKEVMRGSTIPAGKWQVKSRWQSGGSGGRRGNGRRHTSKEARCHGDGWWAAKCELSSFASWFNCYVVSAVCVGGLSFAPGG